VDYQRIVFIHPFLLHYHYPRLQALSRHCENIGISFTNITLAGNTNIYRSLIENKEGKFHNITLFPGQNLEDISKDRTWSCLKMHLDLLQPQVIFLYGYSLDAFRRAKLWADHRKCATILISDSNYFDRSRNRILEYLKSMFVSRFDAAFVGGSNSSFYLQSLRIPKERIVPGYDVIDNEYFHLRSIANKLDIVETRRKWDLPDNYFLFVGRLLCEKNITGLLQAYYEYVERLDSGTDPWSLIICGSGPEEGELLRQVNCLPKPLIRKILLYGLIRQPELIDFYSCASCFILPSITESWGLVVNEALACELPVIVSNRCGCWADLVVEGKNGWTFDPYNLPELANLMQTIHSLDPSQRRAMGQCAGRLSLDGD
jgi:1,2-diacylglycerol 3-alpha-glucosyltransferase